MNFTLTRRDDDGNWVDIDLCFLSADELLVYLAEARDAGDWDAFETIEFLLIT